MGKLILEAGKKYTFSDYFEFNNPTEEITTVFGYFFNTQILDLPMGTDVAEEVILSMQNHFYDTLPKISLNSEMAKRDFMIAPVLWGVIRYVNAKINVEYPVNIDDKLGGSLDYLVRSKQEIIVIEAKKGDLEKGFNQLAVELIAMDKYEDDQDKSDMIYGAISIGELWRFGILDRNTKYIYKDLHTYRVPEDFRMVFLIILGILQKL
ncbi:MAG: hypothetical protein F6K30_14270 [Cyanothece sp. SIO2G6]|nr:hypothetical protein [Cyanothece sp. SIO2G6]